MKNYMAIGFALAMIAGCGSKVEPQAAAPAPLAASQDAPKSGFVPAPPPNAVDDGVQRPRPGQANDHSNPEFKAGGKPDLKK